MRVCGDRTMLAYQGSRAAATILNEGGCIRSDDRVRIETSVIWVVLQIVGHLQLHPVRRPGED